MLPYRATPVPLAAAALLLALWVFTSTSASITRAKCDADLNELLAEIETNRANAVSDIERQLANAPSERERDGLLAMREESWDHEEQQRGQANYIWRDCMQALKGKTS